MNLYQVSYDVSNDDNEEMLLSLIRVLRKKLLATNIIRPVQSTIRFLSEKDYGTVCKEVRQWAEEKSVYYFFSKVEPSVNVGKFYYWMQKNSDLTEKLDEKVKTVDKEG